MLSKDQTQEATDGSTAIQAAGDVTIINSGLTYSDVRGVALDVFEANFYKLSEVAMRMAKTRAEEVIEKFLSQLQKEHPQGLARANDPDFQYALYTVEREYARTGDKELGDLLVDLLVDRTKQDQRNILQIVLNESLETAPKLTEHQLAALAVIFMFRYTERQGMGSHVILGKYLDDTIQPFIGKLVKSDTCYQHLDFCGCGSVQLSQIALESILLNNYRGLFQKGFEPSEPSTRGVPMALDSVFFTRCLNDPSKLQVNAVSTRDLNQAFDRESVTQDDRAKVLDLFDTGTMTEAEVRQKCVDIRPFMATLFDVWSNSPMKHFVLTSVGIAIGHANVKRLIGPFADLSIWIN
jgi:hypothetical protein